LQITQDLILDDFDLITLAEVIAWYHKKKKQESGHSCS